MLNITSLISGSLSRTEEERSNRNARARAKRKAKSLGVNISIERDSCGSVYYVEHESLDGDRFCSSWAEVEEKLSRLQR